MSRIPPALAHRLDRLARRAHAFHRFAHHPLCGRYRGEVVAIGRRTRLCLGCTLGAAGLLGGLLTGALAVLLAPSAGGLAPPGPAATPAAALGAGLLLLLAVPLAVPAAPRATHRQGGPASPWPKLLTRLVPGAVAGALLALPLAGPTPAHLGAAALAAAAIAWATLRYRARGPDRSACTGCPEGPPGIRCSGLAPVARRERALSRLAGRWIARATGQQHW